MADQQAPIPIAVRGKFFFECIHEQGRFIDVLSVNDSIEGGRMWVSLDRLAGPVALSTY